MGGLILPARIQPFSEERNSGQVDPLAAHAGTTTRPLAGGVTIETEIDL
jgi:hypothetical protein